MANENVMSAEDSRFELPDVDDLLPSVDPAPAPTDEEDPKNNVNDIDPYGDEPDPDPDPNPGDDDNHDEGDEEIDALHQYLMNKGIVDTKKIKYEDEAGNPTEVDFDSLSKEEQLSIIEELSQPNITEDEVKTIDYLRRNNMTLAQVVDYFANQRLQQYIQENGAPEPTYEIDDYSDDELYLADLKSKYPSFSDDKLLAKLDAAKANEELFKDEVAELRSYYKEQENEQKEQQRQQEEYNQQQYTNSLYDAMNRFNEIALDYKDEKSDTLEIEVDDKKRALSYLLDADAEGKTAFVKDIENPDALIELAWLRTCGADALSGQSQYYKNIISERNKEIARLRKQIEKEKTSNSVVVPTEPKGASKNSSSPWDASGLL